MFSVQSQQQNGGDRERISEHVDRTIVITQWNNREKIS